MTATVIQRTTVLYLLALGAGASVPVNAQPRAESYAPVTEAMLLNPPDDEWLMWRRTYDHWGYSPLDQVNTDNVGQLRLAWAWTMESGLQETTPLVHDGIMFLPQACDFVEVLDARDGTPLWEYARDRVPHQARLACAKRNGVLYEDKLILATHDAHLVALDARTGAVIWDKKVGDWTIGQHYSGGPQIIRGRVVAGMSGCYYINTSCWLSAHDPDTGEELWRTKTIPSPGEFGYDSWGDIPEEQRRGGSMWIAPSYDEELGLIYVGTAVPIPWGSIQRGTRSGDVRYTNSTLALNADTGAIVWYFQHLPGDEWDLDHPFERLIVETEVAPDADSVEWLNPNVASRERRKVVTGVPGKPGIVWTLDAATGDFLWARTTNYQTAIVGVDYENRRGIANAAAKPRLTREPVQVCPHLSGGKNWQAVAYSPLTNALYVPSNNTCMNLTLNEVDPSFGAYHSSAITELIHVPNSDEQVGLVTAVDVATGRTLWQLRQRAGVGGSVLTTGGGLVFVSDDARRFRAFDAATGAILWEQLLNSSAGGFPVSYQIDGRQYIAIAAGGGVNYRTLTPEITQRANGNMLFVFSLP